MCCCSEAGSKGVVSEPASDYEWTARHRHLRQLFAQADQVPGQACISAAHCDWSGCITRRWTVHVCSLKSAVAVFWVLPAH